MRDCIVTVCRTHLLTAAQRPAGARGLRLRMSTTLCLVAHNTARKLQSPGENMENSNHNTIKEITEYLIRTDLYQGLIDEERAKELRHVLQNMCEMMKQSENRSADYGSNSVTIILNLVT